MVELTTSSTSFKAGWDNVDNHSNPLEFVHFMDSLRGRNNDKLHSYRTLFRLLNIQSGATYLEIGCGTGEAVQALAELVGADGLVIGTDKSQTMINEARQRAAGSGLPVQFLVEDAHNLSFNDGIFDGAFCDGVFEIIADPYRVLLEMVRVVCPGGRVVVPAPDLGTWVIDSAYPALTRRLKEFICDHETNGWVGRQLPGWFAQAGLENIEIVPTNWLVRDFSLFYELWLKKYLNSALNHQILTPAETESWIADLQLRDKAGAFFSTTTLFNVVGTVADSSLDFLNLF